MFSLDFTKIIWYAYLFVPLTNAGVGELRGQQPLRLFGYKRLVFDGKVTCETSHWLCSHCSEIIYDLCDLWNQRYHYQVNKHAMICHLKR